ncbi:MAG: hypothetical protein ACPF9D_10525 [Owenweeksia sp.]
MASNDALFNELNFQKTTGNTMVEAIANVKADFESSTVDEWANALHLVWIESITLEQLISAMETIGTFSTEDITTAATVYFLEIQIGVDTTGILNMGQTNPNPIYVSQFITMTSNHKSATSGQGTNELVAKDLQPNESIFWTATSNSNPSDTIQLKEFAASGPNEDFSEMIAAPKLLNGTENEYYTYVKSDPVRGLIFAYRFNFTINNGSQLYTFDPFLED